MNLKRLPILKSFFYPIEMIKTIFLVAIGGAAGSVLRYLTAVFANECASAFPSASVRPAFRIGLATFFTNVLGCLLIGIFVGWLSRNQLSDSNLKWLLVTGFCGGYTTFSAFGLENINLLQSGHFASAFLYIVVSVIVGLAAVYAGLLIAQ